MGEDDWLDAHMEDRLSGGGGDVDMWEDDLDDYLVWRDGRYRFEDED